MRRNLSATVRHKILMVTYPRLLRRIQAVLIDSLIIPIVFFSVLMLVNAFNVESIYIKVMFFVMPFFILEPGMVSFTGGTIGHHIRKIKVINISNEKNINIVFAILRYIVKLFLGWLSFVFVLTTKKHQAIHDKLSRSIVVNKYSEELSDIEALKERIIEEEGYKYPSGLRRTLIVVAYSISSTVTIVLIASLLLAQECLDYDQCSVGDNVLVMILNIIWVVVSIVTIVFGWKAKLYGCRRTSLENAA